MRFFAMRCQVCLGPVNVSVDGNMPEPLTFQSQFFEYFSNSASFSPSDSELYLNIPDSDSRTFSSESAMFDVEAEESLNEQSATERSISFHAAFGAVDVDVFIAFTDALRRCNLSSGRTLSTVVDALVCFDL